MKKKLVLTAGLLFSLFAQNSVFGQEANGAGFHDVKGFNLLNAGVGIGSYGMNGSGGLPVTASFEHGVSKNISVGVSAGFIQRKYAFDWKYTYLLFGVRGSYHLNEAFKIASDKINVYAGAGLLYRRYSMKYSHGAGEPEPEFEINASGGDVALDLHLGGRFFFNEKLGGFAELGYGISPLQLGLALKF